MKLKFAKVWGISYGTVIGQYMVKILPRHRLGKIIIDGVVNMDAWGDYPIEAYKSTVTYYRTRQPINA
jgi:hypothetical protein